MTNVRGPGGGHRPPEYLQQTAQRKSIYQKTVPLAPGTYRLNIVAKDVVGGNLNNYEVALDVPRIDGEKLASSSLILADMIENVPTKSIGTGQFVIGTSKVRPRVDDIFKRDEKMGIYLESIISGRMARAGYRKAKYPTR